MDFTFLFEPARDLFSIGYNVTHEEVGRWFTGLALLLALIGGGLSVVWTSRLP